MNVPQNSVTEFLLLVVYTDTFLLSLPDFLQNIFIARIDSGP